MTPAERPMAIWTAWEAGRCAGAEGRDRMPIPRRLLQRMVLGPQVPHVEARMTPVPIVEWLACDICGRPRDDRDDVLCAACRVTVRARLAARAELLAEQRAEHVARVRAGRARAAGAGGSLGTNTPVPLSTRLRARGLRLEGLTLRAIAERLESEGLVSLRGTRYSAGAVDRMCRAGVPGKDA